MSGGSGANNSWTILSPEESAAETLRPLAEGKDCHVESPSSAAGPASGAESAQGLHVEDSPASKENAVTLNGDPGTNEDPPVSAAVTNAAAPSSLEVSGSCVPHSDALSQSEGLPEDPAQSSPDSDSFSESYTHITASPDETPATLLNTETLGQGEVTQDDERVTAGATLHPLEGEGRQQEEEESDLSQRTPDIGKQAADSPVDSEASEEKTGGDGEPEVRRRRSLLAALERIGRTEEEEEREEEFQLPQREDDSGLSLNKCILGAVILLGLGTIFLSGVFMDLDEESDYGTRELKDAEVPGKQEWLNPEVPPPPVDAGSPELLNKLSEGKEQISVLQAQLEAQQEELKVAKGQAAEGAKERLQWEEVEKENSRLKKEMASLPVLLKENARMKRELESVPALQKELETLRSTVTELKLTSAAHEVGPTPVKSTTPPSSGHVEDSTERPAEPAQKASKQQREKSKNVKNADADVGDRKEGKEREKWKTAEKNERKDGGKTEWKKQEHAKFDKEGKEKKAWKEKEWKKERASRGDDGKPWKDREGKKERIEKSERKEWKEETGDRKKTKHEKVNEGKPWRGKDEKKEHGEKQRGKEHWKGEKEWKKGRDGFKEGGKEKWERKDWKEKGEKKDGERKSGNGKEGKWKGERKQWDESSHRGKEGRGKDERKEWKDNERKSKNGKYEKEWKSKDERKQRERKEEQWKGGRKDDKDKANSHKHQFNHGHRDQHHWVDRKRPHTQHRPSVGQPEYWLHQRDRLQHGSKPSQHCSSLETCAQAEGLLPVPFPDFHAILQTYLSKAGEAGVDGSVRDELLKLTAEFFKDGVFVHDQMSFQEFAEDVGDVLEDMVEGDEDEEEGEEEEEEDSAIENEMDMFEREVLKKFSMPGAGGKEDRAKGEWRKESVRGRG